MTLPLNDAELDRACNEMAAALKPTPELRALQDERLRRKAQRHARIAQVTLDELPEDEGEL